MNFEPVQWKKLGEHTDEIILQELGLPKELIEELKRKRVVEGLTTNNI